MCYMLYFVLLDYIFYVLCILLVLESQLYTDPNNFDVFPRPTLHIFLPISLDKW